MPPNPNEPPKKRRWLQFSLKSLLVLTLAVAAFFAGRSSMQSQLRQIEDRAIRAEREIRYNELQQALANKSGDVRLDAAEELLRSGSLDHVPALIYALGDPDERVAVVARNALRRISEKPSGFSWSSNLSRQEKQIAIAKWLNWYESLQSGKSATFRPISRDPRDAWGQ